MKLLSWNINGLRAILKKNFLKFIKEQDPDVLCLQEIKTDHDPKIDLPNYNLYYNFAKKKGYSGTAIFTKEKPLAVQYGMGIEEHDKEGRIICAEFKNFILITIYTPNAGQSLSRIKYRQKWDADFLSFLEKMQKIKPLIICGDLNVAHQEIDLARPKQNEHNAGFTPQERKGFQNYIDANFIDTFRQLHPKEENQYSWWTYRFNARAKNIGWRIDYFLISPNLKSSIKDAYILQKVTGSDHAPVGIELK